MSIHAISKDTKDVIDRMVSTANSGDVNGAITVLNQSELTEDQKAKIAGILNEPRSDMQRRIVAVVENIASTTVSSQAPSEQRCISFADDPASPFGNAYPCKFEFGGKHYQSATTCFLAQQYTDQPKIFNTFPILNSEEAIALDELMTEERKASGESPDAKHVNKDDVLMHVQRAKFGQNSDLKNQLLATKDAYLVCHGNDSYLSDNMDGSGKNALGNSLMRLRGEYGGTGQVTPSAAYHNAKQSLLATSHFIGVELYPDIIELLLNRYFSGCDFKTLSAVACVNNHWNKCSTEFWQKLDFKQLCPELTILDAKAQGVECEDEPKISKFRLIKGVKEISPHVERNAGVTRLTMIKGTTLNQLIKIAKGEGLTIQVDWNNIINELGDVPVEQTYVILITNSVFINSQSAHTDEEHASQKKLVERHGCKMPTMQEYVALCIYTSKVFNKCPYGSFSGNDYVYGRSSTFGRHSRGVVSVPLSVGCFSSNVLVVHSSKYDRQNGGAGGQRRF